VGTAAGLAVAASIPNFFALEVPFPADERDRRARRALIRGAALESPRDGFLALPTAPGLGVDIDERALAQYEVKS
jgi:L-alanine-DL-glutamate epimerase-like enolase superfamily enzyme